MIDFFLQICTYHVEMPYKLKKPSYTVSPPKKIKSYCTLYYYYRGAGVCALRPKKVIVLFSSEFFYLLINPVICIKSSIFL